MMMVMVSDARRAARGVRSSLLANVRAVWTFAFIHFVVDFRDVHKKSKTNSSFTFSQQHPPIKQTKQGDYKAKLV